MSPAGFHSSLTVDLARQKLGVTSRRKQFKAPCPTGHDGKTESLSVSPCRKHNGEHAVLHCFGNCDVEALKAWARAQRNGTTPHPPAAVESTVPVLTDPRDWLATYTGTPRAHIDSLPIRRDGREVCFTFASRAEKRRTAGTKAIRWTPEDAFAPPLWPEPADTLPETIVLTEGETDAIVLRFHGIDAFAVTKGADTPLTTSEIDALARRGVARIIVAFDADEAGRRGSQEQAAQIIEAGLETGTIRPPDFDALTGDGKDWRAWHLAGGRDLPEADSTALFLSRDELAARMPIDLDWWWHPLLYRGGIVLLSGPEKIGKSSFLSDLLGHLTRGDMFLGQPPRSAKVLILTEEWGPPVFGKLDGYAIDARVLVRADAATEGLSFLDVLSRAEREVRAGRADVVLIDTFAEWADVQQENDAAEIVRAVSLIRRTLARAGAAVGVVHHFRKDGTQARGSTGLPAAVDIVAEFAADPQGSTDDRVLNVKGRVLSPTFLRLGFDRDSGRYSLRESGDGEIKVKVGKRDQLSAEKQKRKTAIADLLREAPLTLKEVLAALAKDGISATDTTVRKDLAEMGATEQPEGRAHRHVYRLGGSK